MNRNSLLWKQILAFMLVSLATGGLVALFIRVTVADRLANLVVAQQRSILQTALVEYYTEKGSWSGIGAAWQQLRLASFSTQPNTSTPTQTNRSSLFRRMFGLADSSGVILVQIDPNNPVGSAAPESLLSAGSAVVVNGKQVGTILTGNISQSFTYEESLFLQGTNEALVFAVGGSLLVSLLIGFLLARTLIRPLQDLTSAAKQIAYGQLEQEVRVSSSDEIGQLGEAFNLMSQAVAKANHLRKQMTADIAHDLRTPLTVISGYIEAMRDGVLSPTPTRLSLIYSQIEGVQHLVSDLRTLTRMEAGEMWFTFQKLDPIYLLEHAAEIYEQRAEHQGVRLILDIPYELPYLNLDEDRMGQVLGNLLSNALRYTPAGGEIRLSGRVENGKVTLTVADTGEGIGEEDLPLIFERFHRADKSRQSDSGGSGLGLAIVKALIEAHGGRVWAESRLGEGTTITMELPAINSSDDKGEATPAEVETTIKS